MGVEIRPSAKNSDPRRANLPGFDGDRAWVEFEEPGAKVAAATLTHTDNGAGRHEGWCRVDAALIGKGRAEAKLPEGTTHHVFNFIDKNHYLVSHPEVPAAGDPKGPYSNTALKVD